MDAIPFDEAALADVPRLHGCGGTGRRAMMLNGFEDAVRLYDVRWYE